MIIRAFTQILGGWRPDTDASPALHKQARGPNAASRLECLSITLTSPRRCSGCEALSDGNSFTPPLGNRGRLQQREQPPAPRRRSTEGCPAPQPPPALLWARWCGRCKGEPGRGRLCPGVRQQRPPLLLSAMCPTLCHPTMT